VYFWTAITLISRQYTGVLWMHGDFYFPIFTVFQFIFYQGSLKVYHVPAVPALSCTRPIHKCTIFTEYQNILFNKHILKIRYLLINKINACRQ